MSYLTLNRQFIFYDEYFSRLKNFQFLFLLSLTSLNILAREINYIGSLHESSMMIIFFFVMSFLIKLDLNFKKKFMRKKTQNLGEGIMRLDKAEINEEDVLFLYFKITSYVSFLLRRKDTNFRRLIPEGIEKTHFLIAMMLKDHKKNCKKVACFCNNSNKFLRVCNLSFIKNHPLELPLVYESLYIMLEIFRKFFILSRRKNKEINTQVFNSYFYFLIDYIGDPKKAFMILKKKIYEEKLKGNNEFVRDLEIYVLLEEFNVIGEKNMTNGILGLAKHAKDLNLMIQRKGKQIHNLGIYLDYLKEFEQFKGMVRNLYLSKLDFLKVLCKGNNVNLKKVVNISKQFFEGRLIIHSKFDVLERITRMKFSPLYLIFGIFLREISEEHMKSIKILKKYRKIANLKNFSFVFNEKIKEKFSHMMIVIAEIGDRKGTQKFKYTTSNCFQFLGKKYFFDFYSGWRNREIIGKEIELIMPKTLEPTHHLFFVDSKKKLNHRIQTKNQRRIPAKKKNGFLVATETTIRISNSINNSFDLVGSFVFKDSFKKNCFILLDNEGNISDLSKPASKYFELDKKLSFYNKEFKEINKSLNSVFTEMLELKKFDKTYFKELSKNEKRTSCWLTYIKTKELNSYKIVHPKGQILHIEGRFEVKIIHKLNIFIKFFVIKKIGKEEFQFDRMTQKQDFDELEIMENLSSYVRKKYDIQNFEDWSEEFDFRSELLEESNRVGLNWPYKSNRRPGKRVFDKFNRITEKPSEEDEYEFSPIRALNHPRFNRNENFGNKIIDSKTETLRNKSGKVSRSLGDGQIKMLKKEKKMRKVFFENRQKFGSMKSPKINKHKKMFEILDRKVKESIEKGKNSKIFKFVFSLILIINVYLFSSITEHQEETFEIIMEQASSTESYSEMFRAQLYTTISLDVIRSVRQGWIESPKQNLFTSTTYSSKWHKMLKKTSRLFLSSDNNIDSTIRHMHDIEAAYREKWLEAEILTTTTLSQIKHSPIEVKLPRRTSVQFVQGFSNLIFNRDYENDTWIQELKSNEDRNADPDEEIFRVNLVGDFNKVYNDLSNEFFEYVVHAAHEFSEHLLMEAGTFMIINLIIVSVLVVAYFIESEKMEKFYKKIFNFKVQEIIKIMDEFESKKACLEYLLLEEETPVRSKQKIENPIEENLSPKKNENLQNKRWKSKSNEKLKIKYSKKIFGLIKIAIIVLIFTLIFQLIYTSLNLYHKPKAELITNLLKIYT